MDWLKKQAASAAATLESTMKEVTASQRLAPVGQALGESASLFKSIGDSVESSFNNVSREKADEKKEVPLDGKVGPPWVTAHLGLKAFESDMKQGILKITEGEDSAILARLQEQPLDEDYEFDWLDPNSTARAMAALDADPRLAAARGKFVPSKIKEDQFWRNYFYKCETVISSYLNMTKKKQNSDEEARYPDESDNIDVDYEAVEFVSEGTVEQRTQAIEASGLSWEEEMAKELEGVEGVSTVADKKAGGALGYDDDDELDDFEKELGGIQ